MKNFNVLILAGGLFLAGACRNTPADGHSSGGAAGDSSAPAKNDSTLNAFFPVATWLSAEISHVDSVPLALLKYNIQNNRTDSSYIQPAEFDRLAGEFLVPELVNGDFEKKYSESSFMDETTKSVTFTYSTKDKTSSLQRVDVLAAPGGGSETVKSIYMEKVFTAGDTLVVKKMFWKAQRSFLVITSLTLHGKAPLVRQVKVVWNTDEAE